MELTRSELSDLMTAAAVRGMEAMGAKPTISYTKAVAKYGRWFKMMADSGRIQPATVGAGKSGKKSYLISDIYTAMLEAKIQARIQSELIK